MNKEKTFLTSSTIELSEDEENSQFLTLVNRICYYDEPNLNSVLLPSDRWRAVLRHDSDWCSYSR